MKKIILTFLLFNFLLSNAQDSLPDFSVVNKGNNRIVISWNNRYKKTSQISIQRSADSLTNFKTIASVPDPMNRQNGYMDSKAINDKMFYRLYILVDGSNFIFSKSKKAITDGEVIQVKKEEPVNTQPVKNIPIKPKDSLIVKPVNIPPAKPADNSSEKEIKKIVPTESSENIQTTENVLLLKKIRNERIELLPESAQKKIDIDLKISTRPKIVVPIYHIYTSSDGSVQIFLKDYQQKKYSIRFYEDDDTFLYEIKTINTTSLKLDKSNFYHSGWFKSELYDNGLMVERNRFFIPKDF